MAEGCIKKIPGFVEFVEFTVKDSNGLVIAEYKLPDANTDEIDEKCKPVNILEDNTDFLGFLYSKPLIDGSHYPVSLAVAKTLEEAGEIFLPNVHSLWDSVMDDNEGIVGTPEFYKIMTDLNNLLVQALIKHAGDGMGSVKVWHEKSERPLPDKVFNYSLTLIECYVIIDGKKYILFDEEDLKLYVCEQKHFAVSCR